MKNIIEIIKEEYNNINEVSDDIYSKLTKEYSNKRIIMSSDNNINFIDKTNKQSQGLKPVGLWYGIGTSWIDWVKSEMPDWEVENIFELHINDSNIIKIRNMEEILEFDQKYSINHDYFKTINWIDVAKDYSGIEIAPYIWKARLKISWYYTWDVASGCIWGKNGIDSIKRVN
jgi:hypothetical protein